MSRRRLTRDQLEARAGAMPLSEFPDFMRERIAQEVALPSPPEKWRVFGDPIPIASMPSRGWYEWHWTRGRDPDAARPPIPRALRARVIARDGYVCGLCGGDVEPSDVHIDHIQPWSLGGKDEANNLQVSHSRCNISKGNRV